MRTCRPYRHDAGKDQGPPRGEQALRDTTTVLARRGDHEDCRRWHGCLLAACRTGRRSVCPPGCPDHEPVESHATADLRSSSGMWEDGQ